MPFQLLVWIQSASNLPGLSDSYCKIYTTHPRPETLYPPSGTTGTVHFTKNPEWKTNNFFMVQFKVAKFTSTHSLRIEIWDKNVMTSDCILGGTDLFLSECAINAPKSCTIHEKSLTVMVDSHLLSKKQSKDDTKLKIRYQLFQYSKPLSPPPCTMEKKGKSVFIGWKRRLFRISSNVMWYGPTKDSRSGFIPLFVPSSIVKIENENQISLLNPQFFHRSPIILRGSYHSLLSLLKDHSSFKLEGDKNLVDSLSNLSLEEKSPPKNTSKAAINPSPNSPPLSPSSTQQSSSKTTSLIQLNTSEKLYKSETQLVLKQRTCRILEDKTIQPRQYQKSIAAFGVSAARVSKWVRGLVEDDPKVVDAVLLWLDSLPNGTGDLKVDVETDSKTQVTPVKQSSKAPIPNKVKDLHSHNRIWDKSRPTMVIGSWNIQTFSKKRIQKVGTQYVEKIANIIRKFDVCAVQEMKDYAGMNILLDSLGENWRLRRSGPTGDSFTEYYGFFWNSKTVTLLSPPQLVEDKNNKFARAPFLGSFKSGEFDFILCSCHLTYGKTTKAGIAVRNQEARTLKDVVESVQNRCKGEKDIIICGDFNLDSDSVGFRSLSTGSKTKYRSLIDSSTPTMVKTDNSYDNFWLSLKDTYESEFTGDCGVLREFSVDDKLSDHFPIYSRYYTDFDDDSGQKFEVSNVVI